MTLSSIKGETHPAVIEELEYAITVAKRDVVKGVVVVLIGIDGTHEVLHAWKMSNALEVVGGLELAKAYAISHAEDHR